MRWGAVVVAAGRGTRFGAPKQFIELAGNPMVAWSLRTFAQMHEIDRIAVATEPVWLDAMSAVLAQCGLENRSRVVAGGGSRQESVWNGLCAIADEVDAVFVHDGARPLVRIDDVRAGMRAVAHGRGAVLAAPVVDTIKMVDPQTMRVVRTLDRQTLWAAQTPQFATLRDLQRAHESARAAGVEATDDVALLERIGLEVVVVPSTGENFKVTHAYDAARADALLRERVTG